MKINDLVYGEEEVKESILVELINSNAIQRLKRISQFGLPDEYYHKKNFSRYEHSVGVMILLRRLGARLEEQVAGLLHDVSHTAFSHTIDWVIGDPTKEDHQDKTLLEFLESPELKEILERYNFNPKKIADLESFSLLEKEAPSLCADRVDYTLREISFLHNKDDAFFILKNLINFEGNIVFTSLEYAKLFAQYYVSLNKNHWTSPESKMRWHILANILKKALSYKIISLDDFKKDDFYILNLLLKSNKNEILESLNLLKRKLNLEVVEKGGVLIRKKFRWIDPGIILGNSLTRLSEQSQNYHEILEKEKSYFKKNLRIKILK